MTVRETVDARKQRIGAGDLEELFEGSKRIVIAKGKRFETHSLGEDADWESVEKGAIGRSGNLRAPALRLGKTWLVGWSEAAFEELFG